MKRIVISLFASFTTSILFLEGVSYSQASSAREDSQTARKYQIMQRDEIDNTDALAIPLDESEVEDEEEIDEGEGDE